MSIRQFHKTLAKGRMLLVLMLLLFVALRFFVPTEGEMGLSWIVAGTQICLAFLLLYLNQRFIIIKKRALLPAFFYLLFALNLFPVPDAWRIVVAAACFILCLFSLFGSYQNPDSQVKAFNCGILLTVGSLVFPSLLLLIPLFWIGSYRLQSLNWRTFFANLLGVGVVYLFLFTWVVYKGDLTLLPAFLPDFTELIQIDLFAFTLKEYLLYGYLILLFIVSSVHVFLSAHAEKIRTRAMFSSFFTLTIVFFIVLFLQTDKHPQWAGMLFIPVSFFASYLFRTSEKRRTLWFMLLTIVVMVAFGSGMYEQFFG